MNVIPHSLRYEREDIQISVLFKRLSSYAEPIGQVVKLQSSLEFVVFSFLHSKEYTDSGITFCQKCACSQKI